MTFIPFEQTLKENNLKIKRNSLTTLQINLGKLCNQACHHCHVDAGPRRTEIMEQNTVDRLLKLLSSSKTITTIDLTGGAPELNPNFRYLVKEVFNMQKELIDRCNLTVLFEPGQGDLAEFLKEHHVQIVSSLPCYSQENVDKQRGSGVYDKSITALLKLNELGYGKQETGLILHLVYNPFGSFLPPEQKKLENDYKVQLKTIFGIEFNSLFTITNMPINRFQKDLQKTGRYDDYMTLLFENFNNQAAQAVMCRDLISVSWDGFLYDCDFNQMLEIPIGLKKVSIWDIESFDDFQTEPIAFGNHCYGCTAGSGSSCSGVTVVG